MITTHNLKEHIIDELGLEDIDIDDIGDDDLLFGEDGLGLDSVDAIELSMLCDKHYGVKIDDITKAQEIFATTKTLCDYINANLPKSTQ